MNLEKYIPDSHDIVLMSQAESVGVIKVQSKAIKAKIKELEKDLNIRPVISNEIKDDIRHKLGEINAYKWVLGLPKSCMNFIDKSN